MNKNILWIGIIVVVLLGGGVWALLMSSPASQPDTTIGDQSMATTTPDSVSDTQDQNSLLDVTVSSSIQVGVGAIKEFTVTGKNYSFTPSTLTIKKGDKVKITFKNSDGLHDFKINEFAVATKRISEGQQEVVEFTADKTGTFEYYCSVGNHRAMGMKGTLTVTE